MAHVRVRVYDTQQSEFIFDQTNNFETYGEIKKAIGVQGNTKYVNKDTKEPAFVDEQKAVTGDVTIFATATKSKAG